VYAGNVGDDAEIVSRLRFPVELVLSVPGGGGAVIAFAVCGLQRLPGGQAESRHSVREGRDMTLRLERTLMSIRTSSFIDTVQGLDPTVACLFPRIAIAACAPITIIVITSGSPRQPQVCQRTMLSTSQTLNVSMVGYWKRYFNLQILAKG
jgi:hypothetical protein